MLSERLASNKIRHDVPSTAKYAAQVGNDASFGQSMLDAVKGLMEDREEQEKEERKVASGRADRLFQHNLDVIKEQKKQAALEARAKGVALYRSEIQGSSGKSGGSGKSAVSGSSSGGLTAVTLQKDESGKYVIPSDEEVINWMLQDKRPKHAKDTADRLLNNVLTTRYKDQASKITESIGLDKLAMIASKGGKQLFGVLDQYVEQQGLDVPETTEKEKSDTWKWVDDFVDFVTDKADKAQAKSQANLQAQRAQRTGEPTVGQQAQVATTGEAGLQTDSVPVTTPVKDVESVTAPKPVVKTAAEPQFSSPAVAKAYRLYYARHLKAKNTPENQRTERQQALAVATPEDLRRMAESTQHSRPNR